MKVKAILNDSLPWVTICLVSAFVLYALVGGAVVIWGDPGALSFDEYGERLVWLAGALGVLGVGRGIAAAKKK